jgi:hypothetical protein
MSTDARSDDASAELARLRNERAITRALLDAAVTRCRCGLFATRSEPFAHGAFYCDDCTPQNSHAGSTYYHEAARAMNTWLKAQTWRPARHAGLDGVTREGLCDNDTCSHPKHRSGGHA